MVDNGGKNQCHMFYPLCVAWGKKRTNHLAELHTFQKCVMHKCYTDFLDSVYFYTFCIIKIYSVSHRHSLHRMVYEESREDCCQLTEEKHAITMRNKY